MGENVNGSPEGRRITPARLVLVVVGVAALVCGMWVFYATFASIAADLAFFLLPVAFIVATVVLAVVGWKTGILKRWPKARILLATAVLVVVAPVVGFGGWVAKVTVEAGKGAACPQCAVDRYLALVLDDSERLRNVLCGDRRDELARQAVAWRETYDAALTRWNLVGRLEAAPAEETIDGTRASVTMPVLHVHESDWQSGSAVRSSVAVPWRFGLIEDNGWRVCSVTLPEVCQDLIKCDGPQPSASALAPLPSPSFRPWSEWDTRVRWECFADAGVYARPDCPSPPTGWTQPGPAYCAPSFPSMLRNPEQVTHCRRLGWEVS